MSTSPPVSAREWFDAAMEQPVTERGAWLARHCTDPALIRRIAAMLDAHAGGPGPLDVPATSLIELLHDATDTPASSLLGERIGGFRLVRLLGEGGMATVFLGEREGGDFQQRVAVKLLRRGLYSDFEQRLFRRERQALASLSHPNIAHLIDGGVTANGVPYLIMEYVDGLPVTHFAAQQQLDLRARLRLFVTICRAVDAAHRALIVHRDIKPSNILVDTDGRPRLLDFGIAKLLDEDETATRSNLMPFTPGYAAPEQFAGGAITTATDVYALGVLLYELLLGERPGAEPAQRRPSARVGELTTDLWQLPTSRPALRIALRGDLDNVLMTALATEASRRYASAGALADDIERHLGAQPVSAHPPSRWYRASKFVQRHRGGVMVTAALALGVIASLGIALWQAHVAHVQAQRAASVRDFLLGVFEAAKDQLPRDARPTPDVLARAAAKRVDADPTLDAVTRAEFLATLGAISHTGSDYAQAKQYAERALASLDADRDAGSRLRLGIEVARTDAMLSLGEIEAADRLLASRIDAIRAEDDETAVRGIAVYAATRLASGALEEAVALARESSARADRVLGATHERALIASLLPGDTLGGAGHHQQAADELVVALARWDASGMLPNRDYVNSLQNLASSTCYLGDYDRCERLLNDALRLAMRIFEAPHEKIADVQQSLGALLSLRGRRDEAEPLLQQAAATYTSLFGPDHAYVASAQAALATLAFDRKDYAKSAEIFRAVTDLCTRAALDNDPTCARAWQNLSNAYLRLNKLEDAEVANARSLQLRRALFGEQHAQFANALGGLATIRLARGDPDSALAAVDRALAISEATGHSASLEAASMHTSRARALLTLARAAEALLALDSAEPIVVRLVPNDIARRLDLRVLRAEAQKALGHTDDARMTARAALELDAQHGVLAPEKRQLLESLAR